MNDAWRAAGVIGVPALGALLTTSLRSASAVTIAAATAVGLAGGFLVWLVLRRVSASNAAFAREHGWGDIDPEEVAEVQALLLPHLKGQRGAVIAGRWKSRLAARYDAKIDPPMQHPYNSIEAVYLERAMPGFRLIRRAGSRRVSPMLAPDATVVAEQFGKRWKVRADDPDRIADTLTPPVMRALLGLDHEVRRVVVDSRVLYACIQQFVGNARRTAGRLDALADAASAMESRKPLSEGAYAPVPRARSESSVKLVQNLVVGAVLVGVVAVATILIVNAA